MDVNRILQLAEALYGQDTRRQIFEPLVADLQRDLAAHPRLSLRWRIAVVAAFIQCAPRAFTLRMPRALGLEVAMCVVGFGALAFALQQLMTGPPDTGARTWLEIAAASLSFVVVPAVWRIRVAALSHRERRMLMMFFVAQIAIVQAIFGEGGWLARLALAAATPLLALFGWRLRHPERERISPLSANPFIQVVMVAAAFAIASVPFKVALGTVPWGGRSSERFISYLLAALVVVTMGRGAPDGHSPDTRST